MRTSPPSDFTINKSFPEPGTRSMSPNEVKITSSRDAIASALSICSSGVTHTGQPGPCTNSICSGSSWSIWSPTGRYGVSYRALADRSGAFLTRPKFYPSVVELMAEGDRLIRGHSSVVNFTSFKSGYSILSLEAPTVGSRSRYSSPKSARPYPLVRRT